MDARTLLFSLVSQLRTSAFRALFHNGGWQVAVHGYSDCSKALSLKKQCVSFSLVSAELPRSPSEESTQPLHLPAYSTAPTHVCSHSDCNPVTAPRSKKSHGTNQLVPCVSHNVSTRSRIPDKADPVPALREPCVQMARQTTRPWP